MVFKAISLVSEPGRQPRRKRHSHHHSTMISATIPRIVVMLAVYLFGYFSASMHILTSFSRPSHFTWITSITADSPTTDRPLINDRPFPRDPLLSYYCSPMENVAVGIVSSIEPKYQELVRAVLDGWGRDFPHKLIYVMGDVNSSSVPDPEVRELTRDGFAGVNIDDITLEVSVGHEEKPINWKLAQHLFIQVSKSLMLEFPDAEFYILADADTTLRPHCLRGMLSFFSADRYPVALGDLRPPAESKKGLTLMGGAGNIWNRGAAQAIDIDYCLKQTMVGGQWQGYNSDRRLPLCFTHFNVPIVPVLGMYQLTFASMFKSVARDVWYPEFERHQCTISMHRLEPEAMKEVYQEDRRYLGC